MTNLTEKVLKTIRNYEMIRRGDKVIAAVSGGPDSVFLLDVLYSLRRKMGISGLIVCHLDHCIRGEESRGDSLFVRKKAREMGLQFICKKADIPKMSKGGLSTEEVAREERYKFFSEVARSTGAGVVATGHTLDDQAETILMRFIKGSSLKGMLGVTPVRRHGRIVIVRPLLEVTKEEIVKYLDTAGIRYRIDRTNFEPLYFRNIVRGEILPFLERYNPRLKRVLFNLAEHLREDFEFISAERSRSRSLASVLNGVVEVMLKDIAVQPKALQKEILRDSLEKAGGEVKKLSFRHWKDVEQLITRKRKGNAVDLPGDIRVSRTERSIVFRKRQLAMDKIF